MNKRNYSVTEAEKQELLRISRETRERIIAVMERAQIFQRRRKLTSYADLFDALFKYLAEGLSFYRLASYMDCSRGIKLSVTGWKKQIYKAIPVFRQIVERYLAELLEQQDAGPSGSRGYALDATAFSAQGSKGTVSRVHAQVSLTDGICRYDKVTDEHVGESVRHFPIERNALYLADRAYAKAQQITWMVEHGADVLFRFSPRHLQLFKDSSCTKRLDVDALLTGESFSCWCYIQYKKTICRVRIMGMHLPESAQAAAQKKCVRKPGKTKRPYSNERFCMLNGCFY